MKLSDIKHRVDMLVEAYGDIEFGDPTMVQFLFSFEGWANWWGTQIIRSGVSWSNPKSHGFAGTESIRQRLRGRGDERPTESELGPVKIRKCEPEKLSAPVLGND